MDFSQFITEVATCGLACRSMINGTPIVEGDETLAGLLIAAHGKTATDPEIAALRDYLGATDQRWLDYVAQRKSVIQERRNERFRALTDSMLLDLLESAVLNDTGDGYILQVPKTAFNQWKLAKVAIRNQLPYDVE